MAFNVLLARVSANLGQRAAERSYDIPDTELTPSLSWSKFTLQSEWNRVKDDIAPWWGENSATAYRSGAAQLARALENYAGSKKGARKGPPVGFPTFKSRRDKQSVGFENRGRLTADGHGVTLQRIGRIHTHETTKPLGRLIESGQAKINSVTVSFTRGRWQVSFQVEQTHQHSRLAVKRSLQPVIGIDLGVKDLIVAATPDGVEVIRIPAPKHLASAAGRLRSLQKKAARQVGPYNPATGTRQPASAGWRATQVQIVQAHARVANLRENHLHQVTTMLTRTYTVIGLETLNTRGMLATAKPKPDPERPGHYLRNGRAAKRSLSRSISDASFGTVSRMLEYKSSWYGTRLVRADQFFPSSKKCSRCGTVKTKLSLAERVFHCDDCGNTTDRDLNAAINLAQLAQLETAAAPAAPAPPAELAVPDEGSSFVNGRDTTKPAPVRSRVDEAVTPPAPRGHLTRKGQAGINLGEKILTRPDN